MGDCFQSSQYLSCTQPVTNASQSVLQDPESSVEDICTAMSTAIEREFECMKATEGCARFNCTTDASIFLEEDIFGAEFVTDCGSLDEAATCTTGKITTNGDALFPFECNQNKTRFECRKTLEVELGDAYYYNSDAELNCNDVEANIKAFFECYAGCQAFSCDSFFAANPDFNCNTAAIEESCREVAKDNAGGSLQVGVAASLAVLAMALRLIK